jgi:hypothetical protein
LLPVVSIIAAAVAARAWLLFRTPYVPGMNGGYYLVQARALLERGVLGIPDMPLTFHLHAALAWSLAQVGGMAQTEAIVWAVKLCDALLPPLVAWPVLVLVRRWARARAQGDVVPLAAAALACLAAPFLVIVGDLQKNSMALVWLAALAVTLHGWLGAPTPKRAVAVLVTLALLGLTHIGVLGAALVLLAAVMSVFLVRQRGFAPWRQMLPWMGAGVVLLVLAAALVLWKFDPARIHRLITALTSPLTFSADGKQMPTPPGGGMGVERWVPALGFALAVVPALFIAWRRRKELPAADVALVTGGALTVLALTGPWFSMDKAVRFYVIALLPAILVGAFAVLHIATPWRRRFALAVVLLLGVGSTAASLSRGGRAVLSDAAMRELQSLAPYIRTPDRTLVAAPHGVEWWSAWFLGTRIAQPEALRPDDWKRYDAVLFLEVKAGMQANMGFGGGRPPGDGRGPGPGGGRPPGDCPGPGNGDPRRGPPGAGAPPMMSAPIPPDAEVLHDGATLRLARLATPPDFVVSRNSRALPR